MNKENLLFQIKVAPTPQTLHPIQMAAPKAKEGIFHYTHPATIKVHQQAFHGQRKA